MEYVEFLNLNSNFLFLKVHFDLQSNFGICHNELNEFLLFIFKVGLAYEQKYKVRAVRPFLNTSNILFEIVGTGSAQSYDIKMRIYLLDTQNLWILLSNVAYNWIEPQENIRVQNIP